jgi:hypothetical protein
MFYERYTCVSKKHEASRLAKETVWPLVGRSKGWKESAEPWRGIRLTWQWDLLILHLTVFCGALLCSDCFLSTPPRWVVGRDQLLGKTIREIIPRSPSQ